ncbi:C-glycoside deglycosidase beta subunit domain-containing protein [Listeria monocytogenes]|uniref:C-glycoside deglycosidase beta subunit domain-containing protein n=1 Tax=Listeria monocytogenes TaxID=1639 RepID=UPI00372E381A
MFDNFLIRKDSLKNDIDENGNVTGFQFAARNANYRGVYLSLHNGYYIKVDGVEYPRDNQTFEINGKAPRDFEEIKKAVWEHWDYDDEGIIHVEKPGGLASGKHVIEFQQSVLATYGYMPTDEEWVKNPPVPGTGAGSDKTKEIVKYELLLKE